MNYLGIDYSVKNMPLLDNAFIPFGVWAEAYLKEAVHPFKIAIAALHKIRRQERPPESYPFAPFLTVSFFTAYII